MQTQTLINNSINPRARYVGWALAPCRIRLSNVTGATGPVTVTLRNKPPAAGGRLLFRRTRTSPQGQTLSLTLPLSGATVDFFVCGQFGAPSKADLDATIQVRVGTTTVEEVSLMVRVRKNANLLTPAERDRFIAAFARFNNQGTGRFVDFRNMHTDAGDPEAHRNPGFLPWHRAYLLDLERELQAIDASVSLPYWRFDQPAPNLFTRDFIGVSNSLGTVQFSPTNPLQFWRTDGIQGITRRPFFNPATQGANGFNETQTLALGTQYVQFRSMEGNPHGLAHTSFGGSIGSIGTAARDPLFFLLHANVDRLWAKWQRRFGRFDPALAASFGAPPSRIGHNLPDTMWPWNGITGAPRPPTAPGGTLASSPSITAPGLSPRVRDCLDYQGTLSPAARLGFDYDDVQFA